MPGNNVRLDVYVAEREGITRSASQKLIESGYVLVNGIHRESGILLKRRTKLK